jgi:predicted outer membrane repeat protein
MSWARQPRVNIWSADDWIDLPRLVLTRVTFEGNTATELGGAIAFAGWVASEGLVFRHNEAGSAGGAIASWHAAVLPERYDSVFQALVDNTQVQPQDRISLARSILVDNRAGGSGAALSVADAETALGDVIVARNTAGAGAAVAGVRLRIVNTVIADNDATGIAAPAGATVALGNTAVFGNRKGNCALAAPPLILGPNLQNPGGDCGGQIRIADPGLDGSYAPGLVSAARGAGDYGLCVSDPNVMGIDIYGSTRIRSNHTCAIGAIERDRAESVASALTFGTTHGLGQRLRWLLLLLILLTFLVAVFTRRRRRPSIPVADRITRRT